MRIAVEISQRKTLIIVKRHYYGLVSIFRLWDTIPIYSDSML